MRSLVVESGGVIALALEPERGFRVGELFRLPALVLGSGELGRVQNGLVRSYVLAIASGVAVLAVVFLSTR